MGPRASSAKVERELERVRVENNDMSMRLEETQQEVASLRENIGMIVADAIQEALMQLSHGPLSSIPSVSDDNPLRGSVRITNFIGDYLPRKEIPVGNKFQADIPKCTNGRNYYSESSKWLGEKTWPRGESRNDNINIETIGEGRQRASCSCECPSLKNCIASHISEERDRLLDEIGDAFYSWGFDNMGEVVSGAWTIKEQNNFYRLFKRENKNTMSRALKCLPLKCRETIVSYYFNVFELRNISWQNGLPHRQIDRDDEERMKSIPLYQKANEELLHLPITVEAYFAGPKGFLVQTTFYLFNTLS